MRKIFFIVLLFCTCFLTEAQQGISFYKNFEYSEFTGGIKQQGYEKNNRSYLIITNEFKVMEADDYSFREYDSFGNLIKAYELHDCGYRPRGSNFNYYPYGYILLFGYDRSIYGFTALFKENGELVWCLDDSTCFDDYAGMMQDSSIAGHYTEVEYPEKVTDYIGKMGFDGKLDWKVLMDTLITDADSAQYGLNRYSLLVQKDKIYYLVHNGFDQYRLITFSLDGTRLKTDIVKGIAGSHSFKKLSDGFLFISQKSDSLSLYKLNNDFVKQWENGYSLDVNLYCQQILPDSTGNLYILFNFNRTLNDTIKFYNQILKLDKDGREISSTFYYIRDSIPHEWVPVQLNSMCLTRDGGYLLTGGYGDDMFLYGCVIKIDSGRNVNSDHLYVLNSKLDPINKSFISAYPNPCREKFYINLPNENNIEHQFNIYSITGKLISETSFKGNRFVFERNDLPDGLYLYSVTGSANIYQGKLIFTH
jgi:hypothetical protein